MDKQIIIAKKFLKNTHTESNLELSRLNMYSVTVTVLLSTEVFHHNTDIRSFLSANQIEFKDYVFRSRTLLLARVLRIIVKMNEADLNRLIKSFNEIIILDDTSTTAKKSTKQKGKKMNKRNPVDDLLNKYGRK